MANENENFDIFSMSVDDLDINEKRSDGSDLYKPKPDQGSDGVYKSLIRFLPNPNNPRKPIINKYVYWLEDTEGNGFYADSPTTIGEKCPVQDAFFKLRNSDSAIDNEMSEKLKRKANYYALVQIIQDKQNPDLEGQIKVYKFGYKIKTKIDEELNPEFEEPTQVFDPFNGKNFQLIISKKGGFPNYDNCKFQSDKTAMVINGEPVEATAEGKKAILEYLEGAPDLTNFEFKPWTDDIRSKINDLLKTFISPGSSIESLTKTSKEAEPVRSEKVEEAETAIEESQPETEVTDNGDDLDEFLEGLDL